MSHETELIRRKLLGCRTSEAMSTDCRFLGYVDTADIYVTTDVKHTYIVMGDLIKIIKTSLLTPMMLDPIGYIQKAEVIAMVEEYKACLHQQTS